MTESLVAVTEGAGKNYRTWQRTIDSIAKEELFVLPGEPAQSTLSAIASGISTATSADHLIFIQANGTLYTRIKAIRVEQVAGATTATLAQLQVLRTSTAGSGGTAVTARGFDSADSYSGTIQTRPSSKGTEGNQLLQKRLWLIQTVNTQPPQWEWTAGLSDARKAITIGPTSTDGVCLKIVTGIAAATVDIEVIFTTDAAL